MLTFIDKYRLDAMLELLLENVEEKKHGELRRMWNCQISELRDLGDRVYGEENGEGTDFYFIQHWFKSQCVPRILEDGNGDNSADSENVSIEDNFLRWLKHNREPLGLVDSKSCVDFLGEFEFYSNWFIRILDAATWMDRELEYVRYSVQLGFESQYSILMAPLLPNDSEDVILTKLNWTAKFIEMKLVFKLWKEGGSIERKTFGGNMLELVKDIHHMELDDLKEYFYEDLMETTGGKQQFESNGWFGRGTQNRSIIKSILARLTDFVTVQSGMESRYDEFQGYEIEHIWPRNYKTYKKERDDFGKDAEAYGYFRDCISGLVLLPPSVNNSIGDRPYSEKLEVYRGHNYFAKSFHPDSYRHDPGFMNFISEFELDKAPKFGPFNKFGRNANNIRYKAIARLARRVWNPEDFKSLEFDPNPNGSGDSSVKFGHEHGLYPIGQMMLDSADKEIQDNVKQIWQNQLSKIMEISRKVDTVGNHEDVESNFWESFCMSQFIPKIQTKYPDMESKIDFGRLTINSSDGYLAEWLKNMMEFSIGSDCETFNQILREFEFHSDRYVEILKAATSRTENLEHIRYNNRLGYEFQYALLMATLDPEDSQDIIADKLLLTAKFIESMLMIQLWKKRKSLSDLDFRKDMFRILLGMNRQSAVNLIEIGHSELTEFIGEEKQFMSTDWFGVEPDRSNAKTIHAIMTRITDYIAVESGMVSRYEEFLKFELSHILPEIYDDYEYDCFEENQQEYVKCRNCISSLLLLPGPVNSSLSDRELWYRDKLQEYRGQNILAKSLHPNSYDFDPGFTYFVNNLKLHSQLGPHEVFGEEESRVRYKAIIKIANEIWTPDDFEILGV